MNNDNNVYLMAFKKKLFISVVRSRPSSMVGGFESSSLRSKHLKRDAWFAQERTQLST